MNFLKKYFVRKEIKDIINSTVIDSDNWEYSTNNDHGPSQRFYLKNKHNKITATLFNSGDETKEKQDLLYFYIEKIDVFSKINNKERKFLNKAMIKLLKLKQPELFNPFHGFNMKTKQSNPEDFL